MIYSVWTEGLTFIISFPWARISVLSDIGPSGNDTDRSKSFQRVVTLSSFAFCVNPCNPPKIFRNGKYNVYCILVFKILNDLAPYYLDFFCM